MHNPVKMAEKQLFVQNYESCKSADFAGDIEVSERGVPDGWTKSVVCIEKIRQVAQLKKRGFSCKPKEKPPKDGVK